MITFAFYYLHLLTFNVNGLNIQSSVMWSRLRYVNKTYNLSPTSHFTIVSFLFQFFRCPKGGYVHYSDPLIFPCTFLTQCKSLHSFSTIQKIALNSILCLLSFSASPFPLDSALQKFKRIFLTPHVPASCRVRERKKLSRQN